jgi:hypothetical protein
MDRTVLSTARNASRTCRCRFLRSQPVLSPDRPFSDDLPLRSIVPLGKSCKPARSGVPRGSRGSSRSLHARGGRYCGCCLLKRDRLSSSLVPYLAVALPPLASSDSEGTSWIASPPATHPKMVEHLLGHASIQLTLDRYSHWIPVHGKARRQQHGRGVGIESTADVLLTKPPTRTSRAFPFCGVCRQKREPTSGLEPLSCSLRVCGQWLLSVAQACKSRINKRFFFPSFARYCRVLRSG